MWVDGQGLSHKGTGAPPFSEAQHHRAGEWGLRPRALDLPAVPTTPRRWTSNQARLPGNWAATQAFLHFYVHFHVHFCMLSPFSHVPALCDPVDCSPPDSSVHGASPGNNTAVGCHALPSSGPSQPRDRIRYLTHFLHWQVGSLPLAPPGKP